MTQHTRRTLLRLLLAAPFAGVAGIVLGKRAEAEPIKAVAGGVGPPFATSGYVQCPDDDGDTPWTGYTYSDSACVTSTFVVSDAKITDFDRVWTNGTMVYRSL